MLVCEQCGGKNIQILAWVDANTYEYRSGGCGEEDDRWCEDCQEHVTFVDEDEFFKFGEEE